MRALVLLIIIAIMGGTTCFAQEKARIRTKELGY